MRRYVLALPLFCCWTPSFKGFALLLEIILFLDVAEFATITALEPPILV